MITRRDLLVATLLSSGGLLLARRFPVAMAGRGVAASEKLGPLIEIAPSGAIAVHVFKQEMGQGASTGIAMLAAEELDAPWSAVEIKALDFSKSVDGYDALWGRFGTGGSLSIESEWEATRRAGACAREMLRQAAANQWQVPRSECETREGLVIHRGSGRSLSYGALVAAAAALPVPEDAPFKSPEDYRIIGQPHAGLGCEAMVTGRMTYGLDVSLPGMLHAMILRPPIQGDTLAGFEAEQASRLPGVLQVFPLEPISRSELFDKGIRGGLVVVADSTWACIKARRLLQPDWKGGSPNAGRHSAELFPVLDAIKDIPDELAQSAGRQLAGFKPHQPVISAEFSNPFLAHGLMEPLNAVAHFRDEHHLEIWTGTQSPQHSAHHLAANFQLPVENIVVHTHRMGGGYGRRYFCDFMVEAAAIAKKVGKPVKLTWTREDEIQFGAYHPLRKDYYRATLDDDGNIDALALSSMSTHEWGGGEMRYLYGFNHLYVNSHHHADAIVQWGSWRSVVMHQDTFSREIFIDELAHAAGKDPLNYRIQQTQRAVPKDYRAKGNEQILEQLPGLKKLQVQVLEALAAFCGWGKKRPKNHGLGVAVAAYHDRSFCAQAVEVVVEGQAYRVKKVYVVADCGLVINPNLVRGQIESAILWGLTPVLYGGVDVVDGAVVQSNFHDMPLATMADCPEIVIQLHNFADRPPSGVGEFGVVPLAPATSNALFAVTGKRLRDFPLRL